MVLYGEAGTGFQFLIGTIKTNHPLGILGENI